MEARILSIAAQFETGTNLMRRALHGVTSEQLRAHPAPESNSMLWIAGHLVYFRDRLLSVLGEEHPLSWEPLFATGTHFDDAEEYPDAEELLRAWESVSSGLDERLNTLDVNVLSQAPRMRMPTADGSLAGALYMFTFHEAYHLGQLGYLRRWLGLSPLF